MFKRFFYSEATSISRRSYFWNTIAGCVNAAEAVIFLSVVARVVNDEAAGILTIAFAVGNLLMNVGKFGVRNFQVTDIDNYSFSDYFSLRIITTTAMFVFSVLFVTFKCLLGNYDAEKAISVLSICLIYCLESFEDVYLGHYQSKGRLDVASKVFIVRWLGIIVIFIASVLFFKVMSLSIILSFLFSIILELVLIRDANSVINVDKFKVSFALVKKIAANCLPLFAFAFLTFYITNAPKYAIDNVLSNSDQAVFGILAMPVFLIELLNNFIYQPQLVDLSKEWNNRVYHSFSIRMIKQFVYILILTLVCSGCSYVFGNHLLTIIFSVNVDDYRSELLVLMLAGGMMAIMGYTSVIITVMRKQIFMLIGMAVVSLFALFGFEYFVKSSGLLGAAKYSLLLFSIVAIYNCVCIVVFMNKQKRKIR